MARVLLAVSGGIAAYKAVDILRVLQRRDHRVRVIMTAGAQRFVGPATFAALSGQEVGTRLFGASEAPDFRHLELAREADLMLVAPATANTIARLASGAADDLLGSCHLAFRGPLVVAPAMNTAMYLHPATGANLATLADRGAVIVGPDAGLLADGDVGPGRLAQPEAIADAVDAALAGGPLAGRRVLITAGGTREPIDAVRYVGNRSSGRMGWALAEVARARGARATVIAANVDLPRRGDVTYRDAPTAERMRELTLAGLADCDLLVMAAAVADYRPRAAEAGKLDKGAAAELTIQMERTDDILSEAVRRPGARVVVGFAAEHGPAGLERARAKRRRKGVDLLVYNDIAAPGVGFGADENAITIIGPGDAERSLARMDKRACAGHILDAAAELLASSD